MTAQPLGEIADIVRGISFPRDAKSLVPRDGDVACLRTTNVQRDVEWDDLWFVPTEHVKRPEQFVQPGDILISTANSYELVGKVALVSAIPRQATLGAFISLIRPRPGVDAKYLYHQLAWGRTQSRIRDTASTTTNISNVSTKKLAALELEVPPLDEQRRIVAEIEKQFSRLDEAVANLKRVKANLKRYKAAVLETAVEGRLVPTEAELARHRAEPYETASEFLRRVLQDRARSWSGKGKLRAPHEPVEAAGDLPEGWCYATWDQLSHWVTYGFTRPMPHVQTGVPIVTARHVANGRINFQDVDFTSTAAFSELSDKDRPQLGDILITKDGAIGRAAVVETDMPFCINQSVAIVWLRSLTADPRYLLLVIESPGTQSHIRDRARGVAIQHLSITDFAKMPVPLPPLAEQRRIVSEADKCLSIVQELELEAEKSVARAAALRAAILRTAFEPSLDRIVRVAANSVRNAGDATR